MNRTQKHADHLTAEAMTAAKNRGHALTLEADTQPCEAKRIVRTLTCKCCPAWAQIDTNPPANGIDIGGPAVAENCPIPRCWLCNGDASIYESGLCWPCYTWAEGVDRALGLADDLTEPQYKALAAAVGLGR